MTAALDLDPYLLPLPAPDSPVVIPHRATSLHAHLNGRYADPAWPLAPLTGNPSVTKANREAARHGLTGENIPDDPHGTIGLGRFRRSLAWHIARRPNGLVALAIQYGHMRTALAYDWTTEGYGSRSRDGIHDLIDLETARATADTVMDLHESLEGGGISGPAARRAIRAAATAPRFAGTPITLASARKLLKNEDAMIYDNPHALVLCHYKRERALCHRDNAKDTPSLDRCVPGCGNIARTDQQAAQLRDRADHLESQAASMPRPIGDRLRASAARLREQADNHDRTARGSVIPFPGRAPARPRD